MDIMSEFEKLRYDENYAKIICEKLNVLPQNQNRELLEKFAEFSRVNSLKYAEPWFLYKLGCSYYNASDTENAIKLIKSACDIFEKQADDQGVINAYIALMSIYSYEYRFDEAIETGIMAIDIAGRTRDYESMSIIKASMAGIYIDIEDYEEAKYISEELEKISYVGNRQNEVIIALNRAICEMKTGNLEQAEKYVQKSEKLALGSSENTMSMVLQEKANLCKLKGLYDEAEKIYKESTDISRRNGFYLSLAETLLDWMEMDFIRQNYELVIEKSRQVLSSIESQENLKILKRLYSLLGNSYKALGNTQLAFFNLEKYIEADKKISEALKSVNLKTLESRRAKDKIETYIMLSSQKDRLYDASQNIMSNLKEENVFTILADEIRKIIRTDIVQVASYNESEGVFEYKISIENGVKIQLEPSPIEGNTFAGYCIRNNKELFINDIENEYYRYIKDYDSYIVKIRELQNSEENEFAEKFPGSALFVPVSYEEKVTGVISVQSYEKNAYTLDDLNDLRVIARYAGIAFNNARNYARLEHSANHDFLTKLFTRSHILNIGKAIYKRNIEIQLCILMIDIDNFKNVNDTYGHTVGDIVLKKVADIIKYSVRNNDYVGRYGGEEFIVLMNEVNAEVYLEVAERIRRNVSESSNTRISPEEEIKVTVSIGLSCMSVEKKEIDQLIKESDIALYQAKAAGRNTVVVYKE